MFLLLYLAATSSDFPVNNETVHKGEQNEQISIDILLMDIDIIFL